MARDIRYEIEEMYGILSQTPSGWTKELNLISWNGAKAKFDLREWAPDHEKMGKGITLSEGEAREVYEVLKAVFES